MNVTSRPLLPFGIVIAIILWRVMFAAPVEGAQTATPEAELTQAPRGLSVSVKYDASRGRLRAKPDQAANSPLHVRAGAPDAQGQQLIEFIGVIAGDFDLRDYLVQDDGTTLPESFSLPVRVVSHLPVGSDTDVVGIRRSSPELRHSYVVIVIVLGIIWLSVPLIVIVRRALRKGASEAPAPSATVPTLADEIRHLLTEGKKQPLSVPERGRLELLVMQFLQQEGAVAPESTITLAQQAVRLGELRTNPQTRELVLAIEVWLHQRPVPDSATQRADQAAAALDSFQQRSLGKSNTASQERTT